MKKADVQSLVARLPAPLMRKLDAAAKKADRSRAAEARVRLEQSFVQEPAPNGRRVATASASANTNPAA